MWGNKKDNKGLSSIGACGVCQSIDRRCLRGEKKFRLRLMSRDACGLQRSWVPVRTNQSGGTGGRSSRRA